MNDMGKKRHRQLMFSNNHEIADRERLLKKIAFAFEI